MAMSTRGEQVRILPVERLRELQTEIGYFREHEVLNGFQAWITKSLYRFEIPQVGFPIRSIILVAIPHPAYAKVEFRRRDKTYACMSLVMSDFEGCEKQLLDFLGAGQYHAQSASNLPLKRLAVKSGLAVYGRNNITYVDGMGSMLSFMSFFSDLAPVDTGWMEVRQAERCTRCEACLKTCPTGAIRSDRFLIDNERCLSFLNEGTEPFPEWLSASVHHCVYDCLRCQLVCPMNKEYALNVSGPIAFSEEETEALLLGIPFDAYPSELKNKAKLLGLHQWPAGIPRNLRALFEQT